MPTFFFMWSIRKKFFGCFLATANCCSQLPPGCDLPGGMGRMGGIPPHSELFLSPVGVEQSQSEERSCSVVWWYCSRMLLGWVLSFSVLQKYSIYYILILQSSLITTSSFLHINVKLLLKSTPKQVHISVTANK